jgi:hypothetical protein
MGDHTPLDQRQPWIFASAMSWMWPHRELTRCLQWPPLSEDERTKCATLVTETDTARRGLNMPVYSLVFVSSITF